MNKYSSSLLKRILILVLIPFAISCVIFIILIVPSVNILLPATLMLVYIFFSYKFLQINLRGVFNDIKSTVIYDEKDNIYASKMMELIEKNNSLQGQIMQIDEKISEVGAERESITELEARSEEKIEELNANVRVYSELITAILNVSPQMIAINDAKGRIVYANSSLLNRLSYKKEHLIGTYFSMLLTNSDDNLSYNERENIMRSVEMGSDKPTLVQLVKGTGSELIGISSKWVSSNMNFLIMRAINDELRLKSAILRKNREIEYANRISATLISNKSLDQLLESIVERVHNFFKIKDSAVFTFDSNKWEITISSNDQEFLINQEMVEILNGVDFDEVRHVNFSDNSDNSGSNLLATLYKSEKQKIVLVLKVESRMSSNDMTIIKMFSSQASIVVQRAILFEQMKQRFLKTLAVLVDIIEVKDKYTEGHSRRVQLFAVELAKKLNLSDEEIESVEIAGIMHDLGKIAIPQCIINKKGKLTHEEFEIMKLHPTKGFEILDKINLDPRIKEAVAYHHTGYDLKGYPKTDLEEQPYFASLIAVADAFDAMTTNRSYSNAKTVKEAINELIRWKGKQFRPDMVDAMVEILNDPRSLVSRHLNQIGEEDGL